MHMYFAGKSLQVWSFSSPYSKAYYESFQTSLNSLNYFRKLSILDVLQGSEYASGIFTYSD